MGVLPLRIEAGRYELCHFICGGKRGLPLKYCVCRCCCLNKIEDEIHFLLECPLYYDLRVILLDVCKSNINDFSLFNGDVSSSFSLILGNKNKLVVHAVATFIWRAYSMRFKRLKHILAN